MLLYRVTLTGACETHGARASLSRLLQLIALYCKPVLFSRHLHCAYGRRHFSRAALDAAMRLNNAALYRGGGCAFV